MPAARGSIAVVARAEEEHVRYIFGHLFRIFSAISPDRHAPPGARPRAQLEDITSATGGTFPGVGSELHDRAYRATLSPRRHLDDSLGFLHPL